MVIQGCGSDLDLGIRESSRRRVVPRVSLFIRGLVQRSHGQYPEWGSKGQCGEIEKKKEKKKKNKNRKME